MGAKANGNPLNHDRYTDAEADVRAAAAVATHEGLADPHPGYVLESLFDAQTILAATLDNTPAAVAVGEAQVVGRATGGNVGALTAAQVRTIVGNASTTVVGLVKQAATQTDASTTHSITDPGDTPISADQLRDDLVANTIPSIESALNALGTVVNALIDKLQAAGVMQ